MDKIRCYVCISVLTCFFLSTVACSKTNPSVAPMIGVHISETTLSEYASKIKQSAKLKIRVIRVPLDWNALEACFTTMKARYSDSIILGGSLASADTEYLQRLYDSWQGSTKFDHLALHPYSRVDKNPGSHYGYAQFPSQCNSTDTLSPPWCFKQGIENIRDVLDNNLDTEKQIWLTEFGVSSDAEWGGAGSEVEQRLHMQQSLDILTEWAEQGGLMKIPLAIAYRLKDEGDDQFGLYKDGLQVKPVATEIQHRLNSKGALIIKPK